MSEIAQLTPRIVWDYFDQITRIPRPSKKEEKIMAYLVDFAKSHGLEYRRDGVGNLVIRKPATEGMEDRSTVVLQSHVDMVCEKISSVNFDFEKDPIQTRIADGWVTATGFYASCYLGHDEVRIAYVIKREDLLAAAECLREALKVYPGRKTTR